jgi:hypothetical protein
VHDVRLPKLLDDGLWHNSHSAPKSSFYYG